MMTESSRRYKNKAFKPSGKYPYSGQKDFKAENIDVATYVAN